MKPDIESNNASLENDLETLPDEVATALQLWRISTLDRERTEAILHARFKAEEERTATEVKALINASPERYQAVLNEIKAESEYTRLYERLMGAKKLASLRTAF